MKNVYDNHNHCQFSFDGKSTTVEGSARAAAAAGLSGMCFTDHCDVHTPPMKAAFENMVPETFDIPAQQAEIDRVNALLPDFSIFKGIEIGVQKPYRDEIRKVLDANHFDEIIASCHYLEETDPFWGSYYENKTWKQAYGHYLQTLYEELVWLGDDFDIMGHYDYIVRYASYPETSILYKDFSDILDMILRLLAQEGKALEINTKTYQDYKGRTPVLDPAILKRFRELGGEFISLGSDSHKADHTGFNFRNTIAFLQSLGFRYLVHFENRKAIPLKAEI